MLSRGLKQANVTGRGDNGRHRSNSKEYMLAIASKSRPGARIRLAAHRCFILSNGQPILIRQVLERAYPRLKRFTSWHYLAARRALRKQATIIARMRFGRGRPNLWLPNNAIGGDAAKD